MFLNTITKVINSGLTCRAPRVYASTYLVSMNQIKQICFLFTKLFYLCDVL